MPRTILTRPPGGASGKVRKRYAVRQKLQLLEECSRLQRSAKHSVRSAAAAMGVSHVLLVKWYQDRPRIEASLGKSKAICDGPTGQLDCIKEELLQWIFARREQGIAVTMSHVVYKATSILSHQRQDDGAESSFKDNSFDARLSAVSRFLGKYNFVYRTKTNEATKSPAEVYEEATAFMERVRPILRGPIAIQTSSGTWIRRPSIFPITVQRLSPSVGSRLCTCGSLRPTRGERRAR